MRHRYDEAKEAFIDEIKIKNYIELKGSKRAYKQLEHSLYKSSKMVLIYGKPGTGKTLLLSRLYMAHKDKLDIHFLDIPSGSKREFYKKLFKIFVGRSMPPRTRVDFDTFVELGRRLKGKRQIIILLDEAQMYPKEMLEEIRILSDTGSIKFVIALHKTDNEDLVAKEHFQSRIWETIELQNASAIELKAYIHKRLLHYGLTDVAKLISNRHIKAVHKWTKGNFRECNKLLYTLFEICEYYEKHNPNKIDSNKLPFKILEMAAIKTGFIDV